MKKVSLQCPEGHWLFACFFLFFYFYTYHCWKNFHHNNHCIFYIWFLGFAGYFDATLYKDVHLGIEPSTATPNMFSWYDIQSSLFLCPSNKVEVHNEFTRSDMFVWVFHVFGMYNGLWVYLDPTKFQLPEKKASYLFVLDWKLHIMVYLLNTGLSSHRSCWI